MKYLLGEASHWEEEAVKHWIAQDVSNQQYFDQFKLIWDASKQLALVSKADENAAWDRFRQRVGSARKEQAPVKQRGFYWMRIAAAIVIVFGIGLISYMVINNAIIKELVVQAGQTIVNDTLPDGSTITLNKGSLISYPSRFKRETREVLLKGEAFFKIVPDKNKPFIVRTNDVQITVVGTSFNVKTENGITEVVVETGMVQVEANGKTVALTAGERTTVSVENKALVKERITDKLYNYYRSREFVCDDTPLWKLVGVLNEAYNANIVFGKNELRDLRMNTTFNNESLDQVLNVISLTFNITVTKKDNQIILQ